MRACGYHCSKVNKPYKIKLLDAIASLGMTHQHQQQMKTKTMKMKTMKNKDVGNKDVGNKDVGNKDVGNKDV